MRVYLHILSLKSLCGFGRHLAKETFVKLNIGHIKFSYIRSPQAIYTDRAAAACRRS
jgi:hypothetical protein